MVFLEKNNPNEIENMFRCHCIASSIFSILSYLCKENYKLFYSASISIINQKFNSEEKQRKNQSCVLFGILFSNESSLDDFKKPEIITLTEDIFE